MEEPTIKPCRLTPRQEKFCVEYLETGNASEAYRRAYSTSKMKPETINRRAKDITDNSKIQARLTELRAPILARLEASQEKTIKRLMQGQEFDIRRLYHPADHPEKPCQMKQPWELDDDTAKAVIGVKYDKYTGVLVEYKIIDVKGCAELIGRNLNIWKDVGSKDNPLQANTTVEVVFGDED